MATSNVHFASTLQALEDLRLCQHHAIALDDGKVANNGEESSGILLNKPNTNEHLALAYVGELKFAAGGAIAKGAKITVTTSGWFTTAGSLDPVVGECKVAVSSGSFGTGLFSFANAQAPATGITHEVTAQCALIAGIAFALDDSLVANNGEECNGVAPSVVASGGTGNIVVSGKVAVKLDPAKVASAGDWLTVTTSGYFQPCDSGYYGCAMALANIGSDATGNAVFQPGNGYLPV